MMTVAPMATIASMATMVPMAMITIGANVINADKSPMPIYCHNYFLIVAIGIIVAIGTTVDIFVVSFLSSSDCRHCIHYHNYRHLRHCVH